MMQTSLLAQAIYSTALSAITIKKFCPNAKPKSLFLQHKAIISFPHHSRQGIKSVFLFSLLWLFMCLEITVMSAFSHFFSQLGPVLSFFSHPSCYPPSLLSIWLLPVGWDLSWSVVIPHPKEDPTVFWLIVSFLNHTIFQGHFSH